MSSPPALSVHGLSLHTPGTLDFDLHEGEVLAVIGRLDLDMHLRKIDTLIEATTATVASLHGKVEGFGDTFMGRMLIKCEKTAAEPPASSRSRRWRTQNSA